MKHRKPKFRSARGYQPKYAAPKKYPRIRPWLIAVLCLAAVALVVGGILLGGRLLEEPPGPTELPTEVTTTEPEPTTAEPTTTEAPTTEPEPTTTEAPTTEAPYEPDEELLNAMSANSEIVGRLSYGDDAPQYITQTGNNSYYLSHDAFGNWDSEGAAFVDSRCTIDPRDTNLLIHGHNMNVANSGYGKSFANLFRFRDKNYVAEYPIFKLETATEVQYYVPYALPIVETCPGLSGYYPIVQLNFSTDDAFRAYVGFFRSNSLVTMPLRAEPGDRLMTLSTCVNDGNSVTELRLLMCLRQLREDESVEQAKALYRFYLAAFPSIRKPAQMVGMETE